VLALDGARCDHESPCETDPRPKSRLQVNYRFVAALNTKQSLAALSLAGKLPIRSRCYDLGIAVLASAVDRQFMLSNTVENSDSSSDWPKRHFW
jgi:hypothetical protein